LGIESDVIHEVDVLAVRRAVGWDHARNLAKFLSEIVGVGDADGVVFIQVQELSARQRCRQFLGAIHVPENRGIAKAPVTDLVHLVAEAAHE
jgi:hypothetical protein